MNYVNVSIAPKSASNYSINIQSGLLHKNIKWLPKNYQNMIIITDETVGAYYGESLALQLKHENYHVLLLTFPDGERSKNAKTKQKLEDAILSKAYGRNDTLILALGGGVPGDIAGFVAATYMRGIPYIQIPIIL